MKQTFDEELAGADQKREDEVLKRMLAMPPKPHKDKKGSEPKPAPQRKA